VNKEKSFQQFMVDMVPVFDEAILQDIRPEDGWLLNVSTGGSRSFDGYAETLTDVRRIAEGVAFKPFRIRRPKEAAMGIPKLLTSFKFT
jgi:hypothetical protein